MPSQAITQATETDTATVTIARLVTPWTSPVEITTVAGVNQALEADLAQAITAQKLYAASQAEETDLAQPLSWSRVDRRGGGSPRRRHRTPGYYMEWRNGRVRLVWWE